MTIQTDDIYPSGYLGLPIYLYTYLILPLRVMITISAVRTDIRTGVGICVRRHVTRSYVCEPHTQHSSTNNGCLFTKHTIRRMRRFNVWAGGPQTEMSGFEERTPAAGGEIRLDCLASGMQRESRVTDKNSDAVFALTICFLGCNRIGFSGVKIDNLQASRVPASRSHGDDSLFSSTNSKIIYFLRRP